MKQFPKALSTVVFSLVILQACVKSNSGSGSANTANGTASTFAGNNNAGYLDSTGTNAEFNRPGVVAVDAQGNVYVADAGNNRIRKITPAGIVSTLAGNGIAGYVDSTGENAEFDGPDGIAVDAQGNVYVGDYLDHHIRKITPEGVVSTLAGNGTPGYADGPALNAEFDNPDAIAVDGQGNIYVADFATSRIREISLAGNVSTLTGSNAGYADGPIATAQFNGPRGLSIDKQGNFYVVDCNNNMIRKITTSGIVSTLAGNGTAGWVDGPGINGEFYLPASGTIDSQGNVYVADESNNRIRRITPAGVVSTLAGNGTAGFANGTGTNAEFNNPLGIAVDSQGNVYVGDSGNNQVRKISTN
jgi:sugar lactone lactonase YvrE